MALENQENAIAEALENGEAPLAIKNEPAATGKKRKQPSAGTTSAEVKREAF